MTQKNIVKKLKKYKKLSDKKRSAYFSVFEKKMLYRTTKTENPSTTMRMVNKVLNKLNV